MISMRPDIKQSRDNYLYVALICMQQTSQKEARFF